LYLASLLRDLVISYQITKCKNHKILSRDSSRCIRIYIYCRIHMSSDQ